MPSKTHDGYSALMVWIPENLHRVFKMYCVKNGTTIKEVIITFITDLIGEANDKGKNKTDSREDEEK